VAEEEKVRHRDAARRRYTPWLVLACLLPLASCSINRLAVRTVAGFLAGSGTSTVFSGDDDPELVGDALPVILKTYESLLAEDPTNAPLALAAGSGFATYAFAFVQMPADQLPPDQIDQQQAAHQRAKKLFLRARGYVLQGLEARRPGFTAALDGPGVEAALRLAKRDDIDYLYWAAAAWMGAFGADPYDFSLIVTLPRAVALMKQVQSWDERYGAGAVEQILITFYGSAPADLGGSEQKARESFDRAVSFSRGLKAGPYLALATTVSVKRQDAREFQDLLNKALAIDPNAAPADRLQNIVDQRRARWLLGHMDQFFLDEGGGS
jgi:predicted anti-sigma-YlaC factor YlaD